MSFIINLLFLIMFFIIKKYCKKDKIDKFDIFLYNCHFIYTIISFLAIRMSVLSRITVFFDILIMVSIPNFIEKVSYYRLIVLIYYIVLLLLFISMLVVLIYRPEWYKVTPYRMLSK